MICIYFSFQCEGWLRSTCTGTDKRCWTASKAMSVSLSKSHWQTWSIVRTDGTWKWDLFAHGRKGSLVWQDYHRELLAYLAVTASSHALQEAFPKSLFFLQAVFFSWRCAALVLCPLWNTSCLCSPGRAPGVSLSRSLQGGFHMRGEWAGELLSLLYLCSCSEGSAGKLIRQQRLPFHVEELGKKSTKRAGHRLWVLLVPPE